jgi:hypothetical protein
MADHLYPPDVEYILTGLGVQQSKHAAVVAMVERAVDACTEQLRARIAQLHADTGLRKHQTVF